MIKRIVPLDFLEIEINRNWMEHDRTILFNIVHVVSESSKRCIQILILSV